jgi:hypothetical protein
MSQIVKLRRSSVSGQKPTNANLQLGELALNTTDGKVYMSVSGSLGPTVEELISTNTVNTGSVNISGSLNLTGTETITGSLNVTDGLIVSGNINLGYGSAVDKVTIKAYLSSSIIPYTDGVYALGGPFRKFNIYGTTGSFNQLMGITGGTLNISNATITGSMTGSFKGDGSQLFNLPYSGLTNVPTLVSGSSQISYTGITDTPSGIVSGSQQVIDLGFTTTSSFNTFTSSYTTVSSSFDSRINAITGSISGINSSLSNINNFTSSVVLTSQTSSMTVLSSSYALTASYALNASGGGAALGGYSSLVVTSASSTWSFAHNTGQRYPIFQVFDNNGNVVIPSQIQTIDDSNANIIFSSPQTGIVVASLGGGNGTTEEFTSSSLWIVDHNLGTDYPDVTIWDSNRNIVFPNRIESVNENQIKIYFSQAISGNVSVSRGGHIISGSVSQVYNLGFATTGSNSFNGDQHISGSITIGDSAEMGSKCVTISGTTQLFDLSIFDGANFDYVVKNGLNMRAGVIMSAWNGMDVVYNESSTIDIGNTSGVTFNVTSTGKLNAVVTNGNWSVQVLYRALGCGIVFSTPAPTSTPTPTSTSTPTPTPTSTSTPTPTNTPTPTPTSTGTPTPTPTMLYNCVDGNAYIFDGVHISTPSVGYQKIILTKSNGMWTTNTLEANDMSFSAVDANGIDRTSYYSGFTSTFGAPSAPVILSITQGGQTVVYSGLSNYIGYSSSGVNSLFYAILPPMTVVNAQTAEFTVGQPICLKISGPISYLISTGQTDPSTQNCTQLGGPFPTTIYGNSFDWMTVTRFYTDATFATPFNGGNKYYADSNATAGTELQIDSNGYVINSYAC